MGMNGDEGGWWWVGLVVGWVGLGCLGWVGLGCVRYLSRRSKVGRYLGRI